MQMCVRCKTRPAEIFINRTVNGVTQTDGFCRQCATELNFFNLNNIMKNLGLPEDAMETLSNEIQSLSEAEDQFPDEESSDPVEESTGEGLSNGRAPFFNLGKLFSQLGLGPAPQQGGTSKNAGGTDKNGQGKQNPKKKNLNTYCTDLTYRAAHGGIDDVIGRERELSRVMQILCRRQKNNPCLIGEPGVGKTAIAEALALKIARGDVPYKLAGKEIHLLDMTAIVAGTQFRGQFEKRMKDLIEEVKNLGNIILVIDEVHTIASAGDAEGSMNASNILKPALSRGEIQVIGATTLNEYRKYIEKDAALERRFQPVMIDEPSVNDCIGILKGIGKYYVDFHGIKVSDEVLRKTVILSERYITDRFLPDKAIDLLDEALSAVSLRSGAFAKYQEKKKELEKADADLKSHESQPAGEDSEGYFRELAELKSNCLRLGAELDELKAETDKVELTEKDLADVIEIWTGIPASNIVEGDSEKLRRLEENIKSRIVGQDQAVDAVVRAVKRNRAGVSAKRKPVSFIFAGPTGVGKTELVKVLAESLFDSPEMLIRLDMSEFMEKFAVSRIIGAPPGYVGYDEAGQLTEKIRRKPYSVVLFDEIEKAHPDVLNILLQILDDGRITDAQGRTVNFENTIIVMTTNAGANVSGSVLGFGASSADGDAARTEKGLSSFLRPEFINRVDEIITFNRLSRENFAGIAGIMLGQLSAAMSEKKIFLKYDDAVKDYIAENSFSDKLGARNMRRYIERNVEDRIADILFDDPGVAGIYVTVKDGTLSFQKI
ncbi:MAG: ATP-dependent Clp protease ATP-binding subunit [Clostridia bacterium]|nr:ATP-dependent Clp protease ATP-binding subunit [Clostridia bacterium]